MSHRNNVKLANTALRLMANTDVKVRSEKVLCQSSHFRGVRAKNIDEIYIGIEQTNQYGVIKDNETLFIEYYLCYGWLSKGDFKNTDLIFVKNPRGKTKNKKEEKIQLKFFRWFLNESPWSKTIITKSPTFMRDFGIVVDARYPGNLVGSTVLTFREIFLLLDHTSLYKSVLLWDKLVKGGINKNLSYILSLFSRGVIRFNIVNMNSTTLSRFIFNKDYINSFIKNKIINKTKSYKELGVYRKIPPYDEPYDTTVLQVFCNMDDSKIKDLVLNQNLCEYLNVSSYLYINDCIPELKQWCDEVFPETGLTQ